MGPGFITFLSDYGTTDDFVGICHGVIARRHPQLRVIDLSHDVPRHDVRAGALTLARALPYVPDGVLLAVVDPGVGSQRRAVALRACDGRGLVGPDNGLLWLAAQAAGGVAEAVDIGRSPVRLNDVSATFHGRDIFAPVAAELAAGAPLAATGEPLDPAGLVTLERSAARWQGDTLVAHVEQIDRFGNLQLDLDRALLQDGGLKLGCTIALTPAGGAEHRVRYVMTFADAPPGELLVYEDAQRQLAVAVSHGSAAETLGLAVHAELRITLG